MKRGQSTGPLLLVGGGADAVDVRYAAGFTAPDPFLFLQRGRDRHVLVSMLELGRARRTPGGLICHTPDSLEIRGAARRSLGAQALALVKFLKLKRISVSGRCPVGLVRELEKGGVAVRLARDPLFPNRLEKSAREIRELRKAQRAAVAAMKAAVEAVRGAAIGDDHRLLAPDGSALTAEAVRARIETVLLEHGCGAEDIIVAGGDQAVDPHERGHGPLRAHQPIVLDIFPFLKSSGYWGDITRTVLRGTPSADQKRLYRTVRDAQREAVAMVRPGATGREIHAMICRRFKAAGYETGMLEGLPQGFIHSTGHGVGLEIHEAPSISPSGGPLKQGQVVTIEPGLYYKGIGGVRIEDTVVVTAEGCSPLARCKKEFAL